MSDRKTLTIVVDLNEPWKVVPEKTEPHWLSVVDNPEDTVMRAYVKWDGCCQIDRIFNGESFDDKNADYDGMHICDLDDFIVRIVALRDMAKKHFGESWPE